MVAEGANAGVKRLAFKASPVTIFCVASGIPLTLPSAYQLLCHTPKALRTAPSGQWVLTSGVKCRFKHPSYSLTPLWRMGRGWERPWQSYRVKDTGGLCREGGLSLTAFPLGPFKMAWLWLLCVLLPAFMVSGECLLPYKNSITLRAPSKTLWDLGLTSKCSDGMTHPR